MTQCGAQYSSGDPRRLMVDRLLATVDLMEFGVDLMRQNIARKLPGATPQKIESELQRWLMDQPARFVASER